MSDKQENEVKKDVISDVFISEDDVFNITILYYKKDYSFYVKNIDEDFDDKTKDIKSINLTLKYPSQGDYLTVESIRSRTTQNENENAINVNDILRMEYNRLLVLIRKWSLSEKVEEAQILKLHPKIVKAIFFEIREKIGLDGIV